MLMYLIPLVIVLLLAMPLVPVYRGITTGKKAKHAIVFNLCAFFGVMALATFLPVGGMVSAATATEGGADLAAGMGYLAAALSTGFSALGAGIAVASAASAAIGAVSEDPKAFGKALIFVALGEGVAIYGLLISVMILGQLG